jgi:hypothetical protein
MKGKTDLPRESGYFRVTLDIRTSPDGAMSPLRSAVSMPAGRDHRKPT